MQKGKNSTSDISVSIETTKICDICKQTKDGVRPRKIDGFDFNLCSQCFPYIQWREMSEDLACT